MTNVNNWVRLRSPFLEKTDLSVLCCRQTDFFCCNFDVCFVRLYSVCSDNKIHCLHTYIGLIHPAFGSKIIKINFYY